MEAGRISGRGAVPWPTELLPCLITYRRSVFILNPNNYKWLVTALLDTAERASTAKGLGRHESTNNRWLLGDFLRDGTDP
jgi:hypothetical protein